MDSALLSGVQLVSLPRSLLSLFFFKFCALFLSLEIEDFFKFLNFGHVAFFFLSQNFIFHLMTLQFFSGIRQTFPLTKDATPEHFVAF